MTYDNQLIRFSAMSDPRRSIAAAGGLYTRAGLARRWGVSREAVRKMALKDGFPKPITLDDDPAKQVWLGIEADAWRGDMS